MIKYIPCRSSMSAAVKEEQTFETVDELKQYLYEKHCKLCSFVGSQIHETLNDISIDEATCPCKIIGWKELHNIYINHKCIGYCGG